MSGAKKYFILLLISGASLLVPLSASAAVLWAGGEDSSVTFSNGADIITTANSNTIFRSTYAREAIGVVSSNASPPSYLAISPTFAQTSNLWVHAEFSTWGSGAWENNEQGLIVYSPDGVPRILVRSGATGGQFKISSENAAGTITDLATATSTMTGLSNVSYTLHSINLYINYSCSSAGGVKLYIDGALLASFNGNPCTDSATSLNKVAFGAFASTEYGNTQGCGSGQGASVGACWSEMIAANQDTRAMSLWTLPPQAAGNTQSWTPNTVGNINPTSINDSNFIQTASSSELSEWTTPTSAPAGSWIVDALVQEARVLGGNTGPQHFEWLVRTKDGTDNVASSTATNPGSFADFFHIWSLNPKTGLSWLLSDIATGFNTGIESLP